MVPSIVRYAICIVTLWRPFCASTDKFKTSFTTRGRALNFHFGIGVQPERPNRGNRGANEWTTAEFGTLVNWISSTKCSRVNWCLAYFGALELNSALISRLWNFKFLETCHCRVKESWELKNAEMWVLRMARRACKGVFRAAHTRTPFFRGCPLVPQTL